MTMEKYQHIKIFISAAHEYIKHPNETTASVIQGNLGAISASLDVSIFDPRLSITAEFYVSLHELMNSLASRTTLIWSAVDALQNACRNAAARKALIHTYKFAPILARLLEANLTTEKRIRVLKLLQELTYGIKISWQETHLPYLISILTQWVTQSREDIIALSLGVLVNLCYKNLPAVYTLMRTVDTKAFIRALLKLQYSNASTRVQCCKLLIVLECTNTNISEKYILDFAAMTFSSLITAMRQKDVLLLRHTIDFFDDVGQNENSHPVLLSYPNYGTDIENILATLKDDTDPECVTLVMEFLSSLVKLKIPALIPLYSICVKSAMTWVPVEQVSSKAVALIRMIVIDSRRTKTTSEVLAEVDASVLMLVANLEDDEIQGKGEQHNAEVESRLGELMQLFQEMVKCPILKVKVMQSFNEQIMRRLFMPTMDSENSSSGDRTRSLVQGPTTTLYIHALALTADLATHNSQWLTLYSELLMRKQVQLAIALELFTGEREVKQKILQLTSTVGFPQECVSAVAHCMKDLEPLMLVQSTTGSASGGSNKVPVSIAENEMAPLFSFAQGERLDTFLARLKTAYESNHIQDITTSSVIELYEYKLAALRHADRAMQSSLEAADNRVTSLQHRLAQILAESSRLHQLLFDTQQCLEGAKAENSTLIHKLSDTESQSKKAIASKKQEIESLKKIVAEKSVSIEHLSTKVNEYEIEFTNKEAQITELKSKNHELNKLAQKMQDSLNRKEQMIEGKTAEIETNQKDISALKQEVQQLTDLVHKYEHNISEKEQNLQKLKAEVTDLSRMRDIIFELASKTKDDPNAS